jgi:hypothetical protein
MSFKKLAGVAAFTALLCASAGSAWANTAANTQIINSATLTYNDGTGTQTSKAGITVTVALVPSAPTFIPGGAQTTTYSATASTTDSFTLTATGNGPDSYTLTGNATVANANANNPTATPTQGSIVLGATVTAVGSTTTDLVVPADGVSSDNKVNGIGVGSTVVVNNEQKTVLGITDNASGVSHIILNSPLSAAPAAGVVVGERATVTVTVTPGTIIASGTNVQINASIVAASATLSSVKAPSTEILNTFTSGAATLSKFVRNATTPNHTVTCTDQPVNYGGFNYYAQCVTAKPGEVLEYMLVATATGASVSSSSIADLLPVDYVTLNTTIVGAPYSGKDIVYVDEAAATHPLTAASDTDQASYNATFDQSTANAYKGKLIVNVGTGATSSLGGTIPAASTVRVLYQATVKP